MSHQPPPQPHDSQPEGNQPDDNQSGYTQPGDIPPGSILHSVNPYYDTWAHMAAGRPAAGSASAPAGGPPSSTGYNNTWAHIPAGNPAAGSANAPAGGLPSPTGAVTTPTTGLRSNFSERGHGGALSYSEYKQEIHCFTVPPGDTLTETQIQSYMRIICAHPDNPSRLNSGSFQVAVEQMPSPDPEWTFAFAESVLANDGWVVIWVKDRRTVEWFWPENGAGGRLMLDYLRNMTEIRRIKAVENMKVGDERHKRLHALVERAVLEHDRIRDEDEEREREDLGICIRCNNGRLEWRQMSAMGLGGGAGGESWQRFDGTRP